MIVEFIGCTASGKSTLAAKVVKLLLCREQDAISANDFILRFFKLASVANPTLQNVLLDILLFPFFIIYLKRYLNIDSFCLRILFRKPYSFLGAANRLRSIIRKTLISEIVKKNDRDDRILIVDEGLVHSAHNIFVYSDTPINIKEIAIFANLVSLPDLLVYTTAANDVILNRMVSRRELRQIFDPKNKREEYVERAGIVFKQLCEIDNIRKRVFVVNTTNHNETDKQAEDVANFILKNIKAKETQKIC